MLHLTFIDGAVETAVVASSACFHITGGTIHGLHAGGPLAIYDSDGWKYGPIHFNGLRFGGVCQLLTGITRDPTTICPPLATLAIDGPILLANSRPFARYDPKRDIWDEFLRATSWHHIRIVTADALPEFSQSGMEEAALSARSPAA